LIGVTTVGAAGAASGALMVVVDVAVQPAADLAVMV
jgi:hypothetical protein